MEHLSLERQSHDRNLIIFIQIEFEIYFGICLWHTLTVAL